MQLNRLQHSFVRNITCAQFWYSCVNVGENAKHVTVLDSRSIKPVSKVTGGRRYSFILHGGASLVSRCQAERGRHDFVTQHRTPGPNVFFNSHSRHAYNDVGPHHRWAQGLLFDGITTKRAAFSGGWCNIQDRGAMGSGHGWTATSAVFYNCEASHGMRVESPPGSTNWGIGCKAPKLWGDGVWESKNVPVSPPSLYLAQRRAAGLPFRSPEQSIDEFGGKTAALCAIELDVDFDGFDLWDEAATSVANCVAPCSSSPTCTYFTYVWGRCFYKSSSEGRHELTSAASGTCRAEAAEAARTPTTTTTTTAISSTSNPSKAGNPGLNATVAPAPIMLGVASGAEIECSVGMRAPTYGSFMPEYNLDSNQPMTGTLAQCIAACTGECVAFSWLIFADPQTTHTCYLKRFGPQTGKHDSIHWTSYITACGAHALTVPTVGDESASAKPGAAPPAQVEPAAPAVPRIVEYLGCTLTTGMDYEGADLWKEFGVDAKDCVNSCIQDPLCTYFSYLETTCYYKQTSVGQ